MKPIFNIGDEVWVLYRATRYSATIVPKKALVTQITWREEWVQYSYSVLDVEDKEKLRSQIDTGKGCLIFETEKDLAEHLKTKKSQTT